VLWKFVCANTAESRFIAVKMVVK